MKEVNENQVEHSYQDSSQCIHSPAKYAGISLGNCPKHPENVTVTAKTWLHICGWKHRAKYSLKLN